MLGGIAGGARERAGKVKGCPWCLVYHGGEQQGSTDHPGKSCRSNGRPEDGGYSNRQRVGSAFGQWLKRQHGRTQEERTQLLSRLQGMDPLEE